MAVGDLDGATIGIVGYGRIGRRVGELGAAFGMRVLAHDPFSPPPPGLDCPDLGTLAAASDVLTLHAPLTDQTRHLVDEAFLARVRPEAVLVNCGRGGLLDLDATLAALRAGRLAGVGLDVFDPEPPPHHPLFDHPDVVLTPHLMGLTRRATAATFADAARGITDVLAGRQPRGRGRTERRSSDQRRPHLPLSAHTKGGHHAPRTARARQDRRVPRRHPRQPARGRLPRRRRHPSRPDTEVAERLGAEPAASPEALLNRAWTAS